MQTMRNQLLALITIMSIPVISIAQTPASPTLPPGAADFAGRAVVDNRVRQYITPTRIVWKSTGNGVMVENPERLIKVGSGQVTLSDGSSCVLKNNGKPAG